MSKQILIRLSVVLVLLLGLAIDGAAMPQIPTASQLLPDLLQFQSGGHALGFAPDGMYASNGTYALRIEFVGANAVAPQSANNVSATSTAPQLVQVTYRNLWPGITLIYDTGSDLARSTYTLAPGADPAAIRLRYNASVTVDAGGNLRIAYKTGEVCESAPLAWQEIDGARVPVEVAFQTFEVSETSKVSTVGFRVGRYNPRYPMTIDPTLTWNTFIGGSGGRYGSAIAMDSSGSIYVAGFCAGDSDSVFVAKLGSNGSLIWTTFLGGGGNDRGLGVAVDSSDNIYVVGYSSVSWGSPVRAYSGDLDAFAAKLSNDGILIWNTFLGGSGGDEGYDIAVDGSGNVYVSGGSLVTWGSPVRAYIANKDAFVVKLSNDGSLIWNTFLGGSDTDFGYGIAVDGNESVYIVGTSYASWGSPMRMHSGDLDAFAAKLGSNGSLTWHTFLGGSGIDNGKGIAVYDSGNVYVTGDSSITWGNPVRVFTTNYYASDTFAAKLNSDGSLTWNTFLGGNECDYGEGIAVDGSGNVYVAGWSCGTWGSPVRAYAGGNHDAFAAKLGGDGSLFWTAFLGGSEYDYGWDIAVDSSGNVYVMGNSTATWGIPVQAYDGDYDIFVAKLAPFPAIEIDQSIGQPGSYLGISGQDFPVSSTIIVSVNGRSLGMVSTDATGRLAFQLSTAPYAQAGPYRVTVGVSPQVSVMYTLDPSGSFWPQGGGPVIAVPADIDPLKLIYLPVVLKNY